MQLVSAHLNRMAQLAVLVLDNNHKRIKKEKNIIHWESERSYFLKLAPIRSFSTLIFDNFLW